MNSDQNIPPADGTSNPLPAEYLLSEEAIPFFRSIFPFPDAEGHCGAVGEFGMGVTLRSLSNSTPSECALVSKAFFEVARQINETIPVDSGNQPQNTL